MLDFLVLGAIRDLEKKKRVFLKLCRERREEQTFAQNTYREKRMKKNDVGHILYRARKVI